MVLVCPLKQQITHKEYAMRVARLHMADTHNGPYKVYKRNAHVFAAFTQLHKENNLDYVIRCAVVDWGTATVGSGLLIPKALGN